MAGKHWVCSNCGSISSRAISGGVVCAKCGANFPNVEENADITNQLKELINTGKTEQIDNFRKNLREELGKQLVDSAKVLKWCDKLKEIYHEDYLAGFYTAYFTKEVGNAEYKKYLEDPNCRIVCEPDVFLKEAMEFAIKHVDATTKDLANGFIEKICKQVNSHLVEGETKLNCEYFKEQVNGRLEQLDEDVDRFADIERKVFICYVSEDLTIAEEVRVYLTKGENISCFLSDYNIPKTWTQGCTDYWERIKSQITQANVFLVISSNSLEHKPDNDALKEIAFAKTQAHLARVEYKVDNSTEKVGERRTQNLSNFFDGKIWTKREGKDNGLRTLALAVSSALEGVQPATNTEQRNTKPENVKPESVVKKVEAVATMQPTNIAKPTASAQQKSAKTTSSAKPTSSAERKSAKTTATTEAKPAESASSAEQKSNSLTHLEIPNGTTKIEEYAYKGSKEITSVTIPESVTEIGRSAFEGCESLTSVSIPTRVTAIGDYAFYNCESLTSATIPNSVTTIGNAAFEGCESLSSASIPTSVTAIGNFAFKDCTALTSVTISNSVTTIGNGAFSGCESLTSASIPASVIKKGIGAVFGYETLTCATIQDGVTAIGDSAFNDCKTLTSVTIPTSVTEIGNFAFRGCKALTSVTIPTSVTEIGNFAFEDCSSLTSVTIPESVTTIGHWAFEGCSKLTIYAEAPSKPAGWDSSWNPDKRPVLWGSTAIDPRAFDGCKSLTSVTIPNSVTEIGIRAFSGCTSLTSVTIPSSVTTIGDSAFDGCTSLTSVIIPNSVTAISSSAFKGCTSLTSVIIPNSVTAIGNWAFNGCTSLTSVTIPNSVTEIGIRAFSGCTALTSITIPASVTAIGDYAFYGCSELTIYAEAKRKPKGWDRYWKPNKRPVVWDSNASSAQNSKRINIKTHLKKHSFWYTMFILMFIIVLIVSNMIIFYPRQKLSYSFMDDGSGYEVINGYYYRTKKVTIPSKYKNTSVVKIGTDVFYNESELEEINLPYSISSIDFNTFNGCSSLTSINIAEGNKNYKSVDGNLYSKDGATLFRYAAGKPATSFTIPASVTTINNSAFWGCTSLTSVTIPVSVTEIGEYAFWGCTSLTSVTIPNSVTTIGKGAFIGCTSLTSVTIPVSVTEIGEYAFSSCTALTSVTIPASVTTINNSAFWGCTSLQSITIPTSVTTINNSAFWGCTSLQSITIPTSVTTINNSAFWNCASLTIYAEAPSKPAGWDSNWNPNKCTVVWGSSGK